MSYTTKDSGDRAILPGGMVRDTENSKPRWDLIPNELFDLCVMTPENQHFIQAFRNWQETGENPELVINRLIDLECMGDRVSFYARVAELMMRGAEKYCEWNWRKGVAGEVLERYQRSADRHFKQYLAGEKTEDHASAVFFNINGVVYVSTELQKPRKD